MTNNAQQNNGLGVVKSRSSTVLLSLEDYSTAWGYYFHVWLLPLMFPRHCASNNRSFHLPL